MLHSETWPLEWVAQSTQRVIALQAAMCAVMRNHRVSISVACISWCYDVGRLTCWLLLLRLQEWRTEPALLPATVSGSPRTWLFKFPSRAPLITPSSSDCTLCPGMLGRQELLEQSCASWCNHNSNLQRIFHPSDSYPSPYLIWQIRSMPTSGISQQVSRPCCTSKETAACQPCRAGKLGSAGEELFSQDSHRAHEGVLASLVWANVWL